MVLKIDIMDPVMQSTTLHSHSRVIPHSIHSDDGNPTSANIKQAPWQILTGPAGAGGVGAARAGGVGLAGDEGAGPVGDIAGGNVACKARGCSYKTFLNYNPHTFSGTEGAGYAMTWWKDFVHSMGIDTAYLTAWEEFKKMMINEYCPRNELQRMEQELWNLTVKGDDIARYTNSFHELTVMCPTMVTSEYKKIKRYIWGLPKRIQGNVTSSKPATIHEAIRMAHNLMDQVVRANATRSIEANKRKWEDHQSGSNNNRNNHHYQQNRRQEAVKAYTIALVEGKVYARNLPLCNRCKLHHTGMCIVKCKNCQRVGHQTKDSRGKTPATGSNGQ
ncbi:putative reverse transcriptase domain-containing protein [Tanacetum coccineum]|uniref:Reverse transcriptase domain-containing protein n=1 Tax=Tanacetum coccineum TaxID=301880 RepID=A0ABQ5BQZ8_9ASTR